jgi:hypothetical protein
MHVVSARQSPDALLKVVTAGRALKFDYVSIDVRHQSVSILSLVRARCHRLALERQRANLLSDE